MLDESSIAQVVSAFRILNIQLENYVAFCNEVEANKRRAKERVRESKADERLAKFYIFCVAVPAWILSAFGCWVMWRLFL